MRSSSSTSFSSLNPAGRGANHNNHNRLQARSTPWSATNTNTPNALRSKNIQSPLPQSTRSSTTADAAAAAATPNLSSSISDSKIWAKRRKGGSMSAYGRIFMLVFFASLVLFLHALSGSGAPSPGSTTATPPPPTRLGGVHFPHAIQHEDPPPTRKKKQNAFQKGEHDHLAVDPDGHYTYTSAFDSNSDGGNAYYPWGWGRRSSESGDDGIPGAGEEIEGVPEPTTTSSSSSSSSSSFIPVGDASDSPHTTMPPTSPPSPLGARGEEKSAAPQVEMAMEMEMDLPLFELGDPPYALRIHLPTSISLPEEHRRGSRARRAHGAMLL